MDIEVGSELTKSLPKHPTNRLVDALVVELYTSLLLGNRALWSTMHALMQALPSYDQKAIFDAILRDLALRFLQSGTDAMENKESLIGDAPMISAAAALINGLVQNNPLLEAHVVQFLTATSGEYAGIGIGARRAVIATLATSQGTRCPCARL